jgi:hypothetical protein
MPLTCWKASTQHDAGVVDEDVGQGHGRRGHRTAKASPGASPNCSPLAVRPTHHGLALQREHHESHRLRRTRQNTESAHKDRQVQESLMAPMLPSGAVRSQRGRRATPPADWLVRQGGLDLPQKRPADEATWRYCWFPPVRLNLSDISSGSWLALGCCSDQAGWEDG